MTPDKEHAPALMQQAADEAAWMLRKHGALEFAAALEQSFATLKSQLAAAEAKVAVAAEDERDRLYAEAHSVFKNPNSARMTLDWSGATCLFLEGRGAMLPASRASLRPLTQEPSNAE